MVSKLYLIKAITKISIPLLNIIYLNISFEQSFPGLLKDLFTCSFLQGDALSTCCVWSRAGMEVRQQGVQS